MSVPNYYEKVPSSMVGGRVKYPNYEKIRLELPFQAIIIGKTGSFKTNLLLYLINTIAAWNKIILLAKKLDEPLYAYLISSVNAIEQKVKQKLIYACTDVSQVPDMDNFSEDSTLFIVDDMVAEAKKTQTVLSEYWIRSRKNGISCVYLSQSFYMTPKLIRDNSSLCFLKSIVSVKDLKRILSEYALTESPQKIMELYEKIQKESPRNFLLIDKCAREPNLTYRFNFSPVDIESLKE